MMEVRDEQASGLYKPRLEDEGQLQLGGSGIGNSAPSLDRMDVDQCQTVGDMFDSCLLGASDSVPAEGVDCGAAVADGPCTEIDLKVDVEVKMRAEELSLVKRRRGRPPRGQPKATPLPRKSVAKDEEDVCFICFDGGSLVLCDRRGCPKAYHPACIKRDDAFFQSKAKWNCGWHICSSCRKASHYMCYTCTFSLCKGCIKDADYQCVRGSKGLCGTCMRTIMLLEKSLLGNSEVVAQVDFDDKSSWEYLFKIYWVYLKQKLSLTLDELVGAKTPWKGGGTMDQNGTFLGNCCDTNDSKSGGSNSAIRGAEAANSKTKAFKRQQNFSCEAGFLIEKSADDKMITSTEGKVWATNELLEFVAHVRNGDISEHSQLDVKSLVLEYVKENNLRDPQQRNQFICDPMLMKLFGKQRVGHFEMLKLLEYHLLSKESSSSADRNSKVLDVPVGQVEVKGNFSCQSITDSDRKHRKRRKADDRKQQTNPDEYAAINVHNINLIYLPRNLIETIREDTENFHDKVVDSIVRMQISRCDQKPDLYRLVQVVGTSKSSEPYAIGEKTTDVMLDILNLDKKEAISLEGISNQEFSEDECQRLRGSVKCGLLKRFTVGEIQKKAMTLQALKVNDRLESEILRLNHLHARASEKGYEKELKELVEKLQFLRSSEERQRRLAEIPEIHADPTMDPSYESDDDTKDVKKTNQGGFKKTCKTGSGRRGNDLIYHCGGHDISFDSRSRMQNHSASSSEQNISICTTDHVDKEGTSWPTDKMLESSWFGSKSPSVPKNHGNPTSLTINNGSNQAVVSEVLLPLRSNRIEHLTNDTDMEKMWHYQDPAGNVQGPFSMAQLQKWSSSGHFPLHLRIWKMSEMSTDSILLTDALMAQESKKSLLRYKNQVLSAIGLCSDDGEDQSNDEWSRNLHTNESGSPPDWNRPADVVNSSECQPKSFEQKTANEDSTGTHQSQVHDLSIPPTLSTQPLQFSNPIGEVYRGEKGISPTLGNQSSRKTIEVEANSGQSCEKRSDSECCSGQSSGQNWRPLPGNATQDSSAKSTEQQNCDLDFPDLPCPTPKADVGFTGQPAEIKQSASSGVFIQDSVPSWSTGSSLVGRQLPDVAGGWGVYSTAPTKASTDERDSSLITASSLKPTEFISDCAATPASVNDQFTHPSPSHPTSNVSDWPEIIEPNEFNSLGDESLSDLLAEVEAMESLSELASSTSIMNCRDDLTHGCKIDCFSPIGRLSPNPEMGKGDALSSTGDGHVQSQSTITDEPLLRLHVFDIDPQMKLAGRSSTSADVDINKKDNDVSTNQWKCGTVHQNLMHFSAALNMDTAENTWRIGSEATWGSADIGWGGLNKGNPSVDWEIRLDSIQEMGSMNSGTSAGNNTTNWYGQPKCSLDLLPSPRDRSNQGRDLDNGRGRSFWNKQPGYGGGNRSGTARPSPRGQGQRVCKFDESGYCKRGASCSYLHR